MPGFMDKMKQAAGGVADATKKGAATAQTKAKVHGLRGKADDAAQKLGYLLVRERTQGSAMGAEGDELVVQITDLEKQIAEAEAASTETESESGSTEPTEGEAGPGEAPAT